MSDASSDFRTPQFEARLATMREICEVLAHVGDHRLMAQLIEHEVRDSHMTINDARSILGLAPLDDSVTSESLRFQTEPTVDRDIRGCDFVGCPLRATAEVAGMFQGVYSCPTHLDGAVSWVGSHGGVWYVRSVAVVPEDAAFEDAWPSWGWQFWIRKCAHCTNILRSEGRLGVAYCPVWRRHV